jgi:hypothetical protein
VNLFNLIDIVMLSAVLVCGFEIVRLLNPMDSPWKAVSFVLITIGSFGWINYDITGHPVAWYAVVLHGGFAICSVMIMHNHHVRRRSTDRLISAKTLRYLAKHR